MDNRIIIGIDPGTAVFGYSVIEVQKNKNILIHSLGVVKLEMLDNHYVKLKKIFEKTCFIIETYQATEMAIEAPFYGENIQVMLKLGRAQGVAIAAGMVNGVEVTEYSPRKIKQAITGNGNASKQQVAAMLKTTLKIDELPQYFDATDALGVAVCHYLQTRHGSINTQTTKGGSTWESFVKNNPDKIKNKK